MRTRSRLALGAGAGLLILAVVSGSAFVSCSTFAGWVTRTSCDWEFVQSVGGIAVGTPHRNADGDVMLPIDCCVGGWRTVTVKPTGINSGLECSAPIVRIDAQSIYITVRTELARKGGLSADCPEANLGELAAGRYAVFYASPGGRDEPLGHVEVPAP